MKPILAVGVAVLMWGCLNVVLEQKMSRFSVPSILIVLYCTMLPMALCGHFLAGGSGESIFKAGWIWILVGVFMSVFYFSADALYIGAYRSGGNVMVITTVFILMPVVSSFVKFVWTRSTPNWNQVLGYLLAVAAVLLIAKGNGR